MDDLSLWRDLAVDPDTGLPEVPPDGERLLELAQMPIEQRWPYFGRLESALASADPAVRAAAVRCLREANGTPAWRWLVSALDDADPDVAQEAVHALRASCKLDPQRWVHVLFHRSPQVRRAGLKLPQRLPRHWLIYLLADPDNSQAALETIVEADDLAPKALPLLLRMTTSGRLPRIDAARWVLKLRWDRKAPQLFDAMADAEASLPPLVALMTDPWPPAHAEEGEQLTADWVSALSTAVRRGTVKRTTLVALSDAIVARASVTGVWRVDTLTMALPTNASLAISDRIDIALRRESVRALRPWHGNAPHGAKRQVWTVYETSSALRCHELVYRPGTALLDLTLVAGALALFDAERYSQLRNVVLDEQILHAGLADPAGLAQLLATPPRNGNDAIDHAALLAQFTGGSGPPEMPVLAALAARLPIDQLGFVEHLDELGEDVVLAFVTLLRASIDGDTKERRIERWARLLEPQVAHSALLTLCASAAPSEAARVFDAELLTRRARTLTPNAWVTGLAVLDDDATARLLRHVIDRSPFFPYDHVRAMARKLSGAPHPDLAAWAEENGAPPARGPSLPSQITGSARRLPKVAADRIASAPDAELGAAVMDALTQPMSGLVNALRRRITAPSPNASVCCGLLACFDEVPAVVEMFTAYSRYDGAFVAELDRLAVARLQRAELPMLGHAWLHRWEHHVVDFADQLMHQLGGPTRVLSWALSLSSPLLAESVCAAVARTVAIWRYRRPDRVVTHVDAAAVTHCADVLSGTRVLPSGWPAECRTQIQKAAAQVLLDTNNVRRPATSALIADVREQLEAVAGTLPGPVREVLSRMVRASTPVKAAAPRPSKEEAVPESVLDYVRRTSSLGQLDKHFRDNRAPVVHEAIFFAIETYGEDGVAVMARVLRDETPVPCWRDLAESVPLWPPGASLEALVRDVSNNAVDAVPPEVRFLVACALAEERHQRQLLDVALAAACESGPRAWFLPEDWQRLRTLGLTKRQIALVLAESPQWGAHEPALRALMTAADPLPESVLDALRRFLACGTRRSGSLRCRVANRLRLNGDWRGLPLLAAEALTSERRDARILWPVDVFVHTETRDAVDIVRAGLVAGHVGTGPKQLLAGLLPRTVPRDIRAQGLLAIVQTTDHMPTQNEALRLLPFRQERHHKLRRLAETFAWGVRRGRELTGKRFKIHMIGGAEYGYTRLHQPSIYVNPLPLLRGERDGAEVLRGLILHELGHHRYNASPEGLELWKKAQSEGLASLFNLVCDEHLERNLRALDGSFGDSLKRLAAYAFQHAAQELRIRTLLHDVLGEQAFEVLSRARLEAARQPQHVRIKTGGLLQALEATGMSFGRFMRGLRMGIGDRHGDARVAEALALFKGKAFRNADMQELYRITEELRRIFGDEVNMLRVLDQHGSTAGEGIEVGGEAEGIGDDEVQREVERVLSPPSKRARKDDVSSGKPRKLQINVGADTDFPRIHDIQLLDYDAAAHRALADRVGHTSRRMRRYLDGLGIRHRTERMRVRGHRLDRTRLRSLVLKGDPRVMKARRTVRDTDLFLGVLVDCSGSMHGDCIDRARIFAQLLAEASCGVDGIDARFFGFTDATIYDAGDARRPAIHGFEAGGGNNDAAGLWHAAQVARASHRRAKLLVMISDGLPTECSTEALKGLVKELTRRHQIVCAQVAVRPLEEICFPHYVDISTGEEDEAVRRFGQIVARLVGRALEV